MPKIVARCQQFHAGPSRDRLEGFHRSPKSTHLLQIGIEFKAVDDHAVCQPVPRNGLIEGHV
jgi:hypothetical protein